MEITVIFPWLLAWVGYAAWVSFFYAGGDQKGFTNSLVANVAGMVQCAIFFWLWTKFGGGNLSVHNGDIWGALLNAFVCMLIGNCAGLLSAMPDLFVKKQQTDAYMLKSVEGTELISIISAFYTGHKIVSPCLLDIPSDSGFTKHVNQKISNQ